MTVTESQLRQDLRAVRALFSGPEKWTQGAFARDKRGGDLNAYNDNSVCWCLTGAVITTLKDTSREDECLRTLWQTIPHCVGLVSWNDDPARTFGDVIRLLDRAIEEAP